jgi:hypothetical protein
MAIAKNNPFLKGVHGKIGNDIVVKQYSYGTVISAMPDMSRVKRTPLQKLKQKVFAEAVAYAKTISRNPTKKAAYAKKLKKGENVYRSALKEYLKKMKKEGKY